MHLARNRAFCAVIFCILSTALSFAQPVPRTPPVEKNEKQDLGPATAKTKEEIFPLDPKTVMEKVHQEYPEFRTTYSELDEE